MKKRIIGIIFSFGMILSLAVSVAAEAAGDWYDVYQNFVSNKQYPSENEISYSKGNVMAALRDLDQNGVPEILFLIPGFPYYVVHIYSCENGKIAYLDEVYAKTGQMLYSKDTSVPGFFADYYDSGERMGTYFDVRNGKLFIEFVSLDEDWTGKDSRVEAFFKYFVSDDWKDVAEFSFEDIDTVVLKNWDAFVKKYGFARPAMYGGFDDVQESDWFAAPVLWAVENKITNGTGNNQFSPNQTCTTAQILTFLWRAAGSPEPGISNPFSDVKSSDYFYKAAVWATEKGLVSGNKFNGATPCTRSATVTYLWKLSGSPSAGTSAFSDVSASAPYSQAVAWAVSKGVTSGTGNNKFSPNDTCTRGQIVTFLYRWTQL